MEHWITNTTRMFMENVSLGEEQEARLTLFVQHLYKVYAGLGGETQGHRGVQAKGGLGTSPRPQPSARWRRPGAGLTEGPPWSSCPSRVRWRGRQASVLHEPMMGGGRERGISK